MSGNSQESLCWKASGRNCVMTSWAFFPLFNFRGFVQTEKVNLSEFNAFFPPEKYRLFSIAGPSCLLQPLSTPSHFRPINLTLHDGILVVIPIVTIDEFGHAYLGKLVALDLGESKETTIIGSHQGSRRERTGFPSHQ